MNVELQDGSGAAVNIINNSYLKADVNVMEKPRVEVNFWDCQAEYIPQNPVWSLVSCTDYQQICRPAACIKVHTFTKYSGGRGYYNGT